MPRTNDVADGRQCPRAEASRAACDEAAGAAARPSLPESEAGRQRRSSAWDIRHQRSDIGNDGEEKVRGKRSDCRGKKLALTFLFHWLMVIRIVRPIAWPMEHEGAG